MALLPGSRRGDVLAPLVARALLAACALALAGCACNSVEESTIVFHCRWQEPVNAVAGSTVKACLNSLCASGAFGADGSATATTTQLAGDLGYLTAQLTAESSGSEVTISMSGGNGSYHDGDVWTITITPPAAPGFFASEPVTYVSHDQVCGGPGTYQTLDLVITMTP